jgi:hypothetical protein
VKGDCETFLYFKKIFVELLVFVIVLSITGLASGLNQYTASHLWDFQNNAYLRFNQDVNFANVPSHGVSSDDNLVGYWSMDEGSGVVVNDTSGKGNNGTTVNSPTWTKGKYGNALNLKGNSHIIVNNSPSVNISGAITFSAWIKVNSINKYGQIIFKGGADVYSGVYSMRIDSANTLTVRLSQGSSIISATTGKQITSAGEWYNVVFVYDGISQLFIYVNGAPVSFSGGNFSGPINTSAKPLLIGQREVGDMAFDGIIDDVQLFDRALSPNEVALLYTRPAQISLTNYYNYIDSVTNNTLLINIDRPISNSNNAALVICNQFFDGNKLVFQANNSAIINVWTNLGKPVSTTGIWNSENYTTTLTLNASSSAEISWDSNNIVTTYTDAYCSISPSNVTVAYGSNQSFAFNAAKGYSFDVLVDGISHGYISSYEFNNVTEPHTIQVVSSKLTYPITAITDAHSTITPGNVTVNHSENQLFDITADSGYSISHVYVDAVDQGKIFNYTFTDVQGNHTISVTSEMANSTPSTPSPTSTPSSTENPPTSPTPTSTIENNAFATETMVVLAVVITVAITFFGIVLKKGYVKIEIIKEEGDQDNL